jgi:dihydrolipoamide dehydrogenase
MVETSFDLVVVGGGPGGYVAAIRAAQLKMKVALIEREHLGGICLNWGCIPTKAMLRSAEMYEGMKHAADYGLSIKGQGFDLAKIIERSRKIAAQLNDGVGHLLKKNKVTVFDGAAKLAGSGKVQVGKTTLTSKNIILATGARARTLPGLEADGKLIWNYKNALVADIVPKRLLVVGSGAIGIEFASFFNSMGSEVTVVEVMERILPVEDAEISGLAHKAFVKEGLRIITSATVKSLKKGKDTVLATVKMGDKFKDITVDRVILAVGIVGNVEDLGLEGTKVKVDNTHIEIDQWCQTGEAGVYAIGDIAGPPWLAHKASHEGVICVEKIAGEKNVCPLDISRIPGCTYCRPQVASVGMTEQAAKDAGFTVKVGRFPFMGNGKAIALGEPDGLVKTVFDAKTGELLGAHMIGAEVTELIQGYSIAKTLESTEAELMNTVFPHPTLSEMMHESVLDAFGKAIHF